MTDDMTGDPGDSGTPDDPGHTATDSAPAEKPVKEKKTTNRFWLVMSLVLVLISGMGASYIQTGGGSIEVTDMRWETATGLQMSALLFKPDSATAEEPAPAIVVSHGWYNNREMQDLNFIELSRRGYVVVSIDMYGHGNSDYLPQALIAAGGTGSGGIGMYDAVKLVADLPYVDASQIGVSGHSNGALAANLSIFEDSTAETPLIAAALLVSNDAVYRSPATGEYANIYGDRDIGILHTRYDEFFFKSRDAEGNVLTPPRDYIGTPNAQSFLHFGADPSTFDDLRDADTVYTQDVDGTEAFRIIYSLNRIHPWSHFSSLASADQVDFFEEAFGAPNPIDSSTQVWQIRNLFTILGLIGFAIFLVAFARALVGTRFFASLRGRPALGAAPSDGAGKAWFWGGLGLLAIVSGVTYIWLYDIANDTRPDWLPQSPPYYIGLWAAVNGIAALIVVALAYNLYGKKQGQDLRTNGVLPGWKSVGKSALLAGVVVVAAFGLVFFVDYVFKTDFRVWVVTIKAFTMDKIWLALKYLPLFLMYFVANSIALNSFNRFTIAGKEWVNTAILALANSLAPIVLVIAQYWHFFSTGYLIDWFPGITSIWLFPIIVYLAVAAVISRKIYNYTGNPYIAGFINAAVIAMISVSNTLTMS